ncbi:conjugation protein, TraG/TraD family [Paenibacillus cremeus]|uniref:Conjugation protein, TraG/TraD family n=2 Tax=Paenibacillus cremeus TaxID=2163881 RepID=A0A559K5C2_9BACL|nr:conjugation protein, TraG/TraD family [Paenibacillus cremeus]
MTEEHQFGMGLLPAYGQKVWIDTRERMMEVYRLYFHTGLATLFILFNTAVALSSAMLFIKQFNQAANGPEALARLLPEHMSWIAKLLAVFYMPLDQRPLLWLCCIFICYLAWCYSTVTQPIQRKHKTILSYTSEQGRKNTLLITYVQMSLMYCGLFAWYIHTFTYEYFSSIRVENKPYLKITNMEGFINYLMALPVILCLIVAFYIAREFYKNEDFRKRFYKWEFSFLSDQSFSLRNKRCDVVVGWEKATNKPIVLSEDSRYLHELIVGATGSGKTSTAILIRIVQDLIRIARGHKMGIIVLEPKSDLIRDVEKLAQKLGIPQIKIKVVDPTNLVKSIRFNPVAGPLEVAAETWRGVLDALTGDQDQFFKDQQGETAAAYVMLGKIRHGNMFNFITHLQRMYTEPRFLADMTADVRKWIERNMENPAITQEEKNLLERYDRVCSYFENDVLDYVVIKDKEGGQLPVLYPQGHKHAGKQVVQNKKDKFIGGAKKYVTDISMNAMLSQLLMANEGQEVLDLETFLHEGGVLLFNSALAELEELSLMFGQFIIRQFQSAVFRRPPEENGYKRIPIFFTVDEFPLYINEAFQRLLTLGRSFKVGTKIALQNLGQLRVVKAGYDETILSNASNKTVFGRGEVKDNEYFSKSFGEEYVLEESMNESVTPMSMPNQSRGIRYNTARKLQPRFTATQIKEQPFKHYIIEVVGRDGSITPATQAYGKFVTETKFLKRFVDIGKIEFATKNYKPLSFKGNIHQLSYLVNQLEDEKQRNESAVVAAVETHKAQTEVPAKVEVDPQVQGSSAGDATTSSPHDPLPPERKHTDDSVSLAKASDNDGTLFWPDLEAEDDVSGELTLENVAVITEDHSAPVAAAGQDESPIHQQEKREDEFPKQTYSVPDNIDELVKSVHDNLIGAGTAASQYNSSSPAPINETKNPVKPVVEQLPKPDINHFDDLLDDLAASDRQKPDKQKEYANKSMQKVNDYKEDDM